MQLYLLLNNDCNLQCNFCIRGKQSNHSYLDIKALQVILKKNNFSKYYLLLTGGEPTLHPSLSQIIDMCIPYFNGISINTNGTESSWIEKCNTTQIHVQISLDGPPEVHNQIRGNGNVDIYSKILNTIEQLNFHNISYNISSTVGRSNYESTKELCQKICELPNLSYWKVSPVLPFGCMTNDDVLSVSQWNNLVTYLLDNAEVRLSIKRLFDFDLLDRYLDTHPNVIKFPKSNCGDVKYKVYVYPDFTVYPCTCLTDFPLGNLTTHTLKEIICSDVAKKFSDYKVSNEAICYQCKYLNICNGGCIGMSYHYFRKLGMGDFRCPLIQEELHTI